MIEFKKVGIENCASWKIICIEWKSKKKERRNYLEMNIDKKKKKNKGRRKKNTECKVKDII